MDIRRTVLDTVPKELWIDLEDRHRAEAYKAHDVVKTNIPLNAKRSREVEGQIRFRLQEQGYEEVVQLHGGQLLEDGIMPGTDLRVYQPFARFQGPEVSVILGFAAMPEPRKMPAKNMSRAAGVSLNWHLQPSMFDDPKSVHPNDIFVLFLTARDRNQAGMIEEIAVGVIGADYKDFIFYESLEDFLRGYGEGSEGASGPDDSTDRGAEIKLRKTRKLFFPPENRPDSDAEDGSSE
ncbi:MAG TPA: hypothetical protein VF603_01200 [Allosphingosinicella sp.]|jgi:hypothetical protein